MTKKKTEFDAQTKQLDTLLNDHRIIKNQLYEAQTKEMKNINKKNLDKI